MSQPIERLHWYYQEYLHLWPFKMLQKGLAQTLYHDSEQRDASLGSQVLMWAACWWGKVWHWETKGQRKLKNLWICNKRWLPSVRAEETLGVPGGRGMARMTAWTTKKAGNLTFSRAHCDTKGCPHLSAQNYAIVCCHLKTTPAPKWPPRPQLPFIPHPLDSDTNNLAEDRGFLKPYIT